MENPLSGEVKNIETQPLLNRIAGIDRRMEIFF